MQDDQAAVANPFALMMDPASVLAAIEGSTRLEGLTRRVYRPLDRPMIPKRRPPDVQEFDREIDETADEESAIQPEQPSE
jgi:hypothetical protein